MRRSRALASSLGLAVVVLALLPAGARARCVGHDEARWTAAQSLVLLLNPMGAEHNFRVGICVPLYRTDDAVLALNHFEAGVSTYLSPVYFVPGGYAQVAPASFWILRAEIHGLAVWPIPLNGAGYYPRSGYADSWMYDDLPADQGGSTGGLTVRFFSVLRGRVELTPSVAIVAFDATWTEVNLLADGGYWLDVRDDLIAASGDWIVANEGALLLQATLPEGVALRFGAYSALRANPRAEYVGHQVGPIAMLSLGRIDTHVDALSVFIRLGVYTHHRFRVGQAATMLGMSVDWDLGG
ncbi:MAG: hypothetical protein AB7S26_22715 [Sandaracinaceae bacterium]